MNRLLFIGVLACVCFFGNQRVARADCLTNPEGYVYLMSGNGRATDGGGSTEWGRTGRFGFKVINNDCAFGVSYHNEGHTKKESRLGDRDGFDITAIFPIKTSGQVAVDIGIGPYFSMNTVDRTGTNQKNEKGIGITTEATARYPATKMLSLIAQYNKTWLRGDFDTEEILIGVSYNFDNRSKGGLSSGGSTSWKNHGYQVGVWGGPSTTTRTQAKAHFGYQLEVLRKIPDSNIALSGSVVFEKNSKVSDRKGVAGQIWYWAAVNQFEFNAGVGPYIAHEEEPEHRGTKGLIMFSFRITTPVSKGCSVGAEFSRIASFYHEDGNMSTLGMLCAV